MSENQLRLPHANAPVLRTGAALVVIMLHGRGATAENILRGNHWVVRA